MRSLKIKNLINVEKKEINKLLSDRYLIHKNRKLVEIKSFYIDSEATAKKYVQYYKSDKGQNNTSAFGPLKYLEVEKAAKYFGFDVCNSIIEVIFKSGNGIRGQKPPRQLRNGVFHSKSIKDIEEIEQRFRELMKLMKDWLSVSRALLDRL